MPISLLTTPVWLCFSAVHELKPLLHRFQLLLLVRLLFQAVCPGNGVSEEATTRNYKPGQTQVSPVFYCLIIQFSQGRGNFRP